MESTERTYRDGERIFAEGEPSDSAYVVVKGRVVLTKSGQSGPVQLALMESGDLFGEMGILDRGKRSASAHAQGAVTLQVISRDNFLEALQSRPEVARTVMESLVQRLRETNDRLVQGKPAGKMTSPPRSKRKSAFFEKLFDLVKKTRPARIEIRVAQLAGAAGPHITRHLLAAFDNRPGTRSRLLNETVLYDPADPEHDFTAAAHRAGELLEKAKGDVLIWGEAKAAGTTMVLRFYPAARAEPDQAGYFGLQTELHLPVDFDENLANLLGTICFAATPPRSSDKARLLQGTLSKAVDATMEQLQQLPRGLTSRERASIQLCFGNALSQTAAQRNSLDLFRIAASLYQSALTVLTAAEQPYDWALAQLNMATCLQTIAERDDNFAMLEAGMDACEAALGVFDKTTHGRLWATAQSRLGQLLYKMDLQTGDTEMLKKSLNAYQAALQIFTRTETPRLWADVMNDFAQAALVLGEQMHSPEVLEKAISACQATLDIRTREDNPLLWAATQNNLGSALFMLGKMTRNTGSLAGAMEAFRQAHEVYAARGAQRMAAITEKNMAHVQRLIDKRDGADFISKN